MKQQPLFEEKPIFNSKHKGLRNVIMLSIEMFHIQEGRLPQPARRGHKGSDNDRETVLEKNEKALERWKINSQRSTYSWAVKYILKKMKNSS